MKTMLCSKATTAILYSSLIAKGYNSLADDMRIPARVSQWVKLIKMPLPFKHWSDLFKNSCLKSLLPIQRYYFLYIIYYQHCHIDRESIFRRAKTSVVVATPSLSVRWPVRLLWLLDCLLHPVGANVNDVPF